MSRKLCSWLAFAITACAVPVSTPARDFTSGYLLIGHPWSLPVAAGIPTGVAYLTVTNNGPGEELLLGARTPAAESVHMHQTVTSDGIARMRPLTQLAIPPGGTIRIAPGGIHFMLMGLRKPLTVGEDIPLTLLFKNAGEVQVTIKVESRDAVPAAEDPGNDTTGRSTRTRGGPAQRKSRRRCRR